MKVCVVIPSLVGGGAERAAVTILSALDPTRIDRVLYLFSGEGVYFDRIAPGVEVVIASRRGWPARLYELARFLRRAKPDIVMPFLSYFITAIAAWLAGGRSRVVFNQQTPTTAFLNDADFSWQTPSRRRLFAVLTRLFYRRADAVVVTSRGVADDLMNHYHVPRAKIRVLHNPVDIDAIATSAAAPVNTSDLSGRPLVVAAGRLAAVKNYALLIDALAALAHSHRVHAWILGDGDERDRLAQLAEARGLTHLVRFLGFRQNPWQLIARADAFVLTSLYEGFGNVLIEAMACGTPVIATRSSGTVEIIEDGENGLLVDHTPEAVAGAIARLIGDPVLRDRIVGRARASVQHYALSRVAERYEGMFRELLA